MATRPKAVIESRNGEKFSPITIAKNVLTDDGQNLHDILSDRKEDMMTPTIENSSSMFKVGQGDNVDYSSNIVNGAYEDMVLKGKTMVNCIQEPSSQDVVLPYEFADGQHVTINDTKESGALGIQMKGQTLVNIHNATTYALSCQSSGWYDNYVSTKNEVSFTITDTTFTGWRYINLGKLNLTMLKPSTKYLVVFSEAKNITTVRFLNSNGTKQLTNEAMVTNGKAIITTKANMELDEQVLYIYFPMQLGEVVVKNAMIIEYQEGMENWDIPYFTGMASCKMPILHTVGKNLFNINGYSTKNQYASINGNTITVNAPTTFSNTVYTLTGLKEGELYRVSLDKTGAGEFSIRDTNGSSLLYVEKEEGHVSRTFTYEKGATIRIGNRQIVNSEVSFTNIQIEHGSTETAHESYKSSILSLPEEVVLRSLPNGVCDTFNTKTGVYTQRIYETTLVGTEEWVLYDASNTNRQNTIAFSANLGLGDVFDNDHTYSRLGGLICDKLTHISSVWGNGGDVVGISADQRNVIIQIEKTRLASENVTGFKAWLTSNNLKVGIQLKTPIVTKINLSSSLKSWNTATHIYSEIPENTLYPILSHSNPSYPVILKPNTKYSIVANSYSNNHTNSAINFNLGGATASTTVGNRVTTITTPSTLSNELLTMSGRGNKLNNVMVIEGDVVGDEPYFEGICDCNSPILSNVGKNLLCTLDCKNRHSNDTIVEVGLNHVEFNVAQVWGGLLWKLQLKPLTTYTVSFDRNKTTIQGYIRHYEDGKWSSGYGGSNRYTFTTNDNGYVMFTIESSIANETKNYVSNIQLEELPTPTSYEPYKSNILSVNGDKIELTEDMFEQGSLFYDNNTFEQAKNFANDDTGTRSVRIRTKKLIKVKPNTTYRFSYKNSCQSWFYGYDMNENPTNCKSAIVGVAEQVFTTNSNTHYIALVLFKTGNPTITPSNYDYKSIQISEVDKTIILRSLPNGVCDTLNVETGEYVQRIGEIVLDGEFNLWAQSCEDVQYYRVGTGTINNFKLNSCIINDKLPVAKKVTSETKGEFVGDHTNSQSIHIRLLSSKLSQRSVDGVQEYLRANPITVQYELETPITTKVDVQGFPHAYKNGHVVLSSGSIEQSLTPKVEYSVATNRNGQIRSNQKMVEKHQKQLDRLQAMILTNLVNTQYEQTLTNLKYDLKNVREEVK